MLWIQNCNLLFKSYDPFTLNRTYIMMHSWSKCWHTLPAWYSSEFWSQLNIWHRIVIWPESKRSLFPTSLKINLTLLFVLRHLVVQLQRGPFTSPYCPDIRKVLAFGPKFLNNLTPKISPGLHLWHGARCTISFKNLNTKAIVRTKCQWTLPLKMPAQYHYTTFFYLKPDQVQYFLKFHLNPVRLGT